ncbi:MAG: ribonuclease P protein component [Gallionella sp.]|nr:ribonuclease P protein component [Gallionella sp.]
MGAALLSGLAAPRVVQDSQFKLPAVFSAAHRLLRKDGFSHVLDSGNLADKHFKVFFVRNDKGNARLGIIASKRILPRATDRNRVKRAVREAFRRHSVKTRGVDLVIIVRLALVQRDGFDQGLKTLLSRVENKCEDL